MKLTLLLLCSTLICAVMMQPWDKQGFLKISTTYFKARQVKSVTAISCFGAMDDFRVMNSYLESGFYVRIVSSFSEFNVSGPGNGGVVVDARCEEMVSALIERVSINKLIDCIV